MALINTLKTKGSSFRNPQTGGKPTTSLAGPQLQINNTFSKGEYQKYILDTDEISRSKDLTPFK